MSHLVLNRKLEFFVKSNIGKVASSAPAFPNTYSFEFDGILDYVETAATYSPLDGGTTMSLSVWIKPVTGDSY